MNSGLCPGDDLSRWVDVRGSKAAAVAATGLLWAAVWTAAIPAAAHAAALLADSSTANIERTDFVNWARQSAFALSTVLAGSSADEDLRALGRMIGDATIVALSEGVHAGAEPLELRNRLFQYLVEERGFTAIAIESGLVEGRVVHDYVRGGPGELRRVLYSGFTWTFDNLPQNQTLVRWMRDYNADPRHARKINFYGFDVAGSPGNPNPHRGPDTALVETLRFLRRVDAESAAVFHARLDALLPRIRFDFGQSGASPGYETLDQRDRDAISAAIADLVALMDRKEAKFTAAASESDYAWGHRAAIGARQTDEWLRQIPIGWRPIVSHGHVDYHGDNARFLSTAQDLRDRAQADNIDWVVKREGPTGRILLFAHRYHISAAAVTTTWSSAQGPVHLRQEPAGTYLRRRYGDRLVTVGNLIGRGKVACSGYAETLEPRDSFDGLAGRVGSPLFILDLRSAPAPIAAWLEQPQPLGSGDDAFEVAVGKAFDILTYIDALTPACPG
jgi:erythromycin esterase